MSAFNLGSAERQSQTLHLLLDRSSRKRTSSRMLWTSSQGIEAFSKSSSFSSYATQTLKRREYNWVAEDNEYMQKIGVISLWLRRTT